MTRQIMHPEVLDLICSYIGDKPNCKVVTIGRKRRSL